MALAPVLLLVSIGLAGCNERTPVTDPGVVAPSPSPAPSPAPRPAPSPAPSPAPLPITVIGISLDPPALFGGLSGSGAVLLSRPTPPGGAVVTLTSSNGAAASVPATVAFSEGTDRVAFPIATLPLATDQAVTITGSAPGGSGGNVLTLWSRSSGSFMTWYDELGTIIGSAGIGHWTPPAATFRPPARGQNLISLSISTSGTSFWTARFGAPGTEPLHVGSYENAQRIPPFGNPVPTLDVGGSRRSCNLTFGRFEVREIAFGADGTLMRFDAVFEEHCESSTNPAIRGEVRYVAGQ